MFNQSDQIYKRRGPGVREAPGDRRVGLGGGVHQMGSSRVKECFCFSAILCNHQRIIGVCALPPSNKWSSEPIGLGNLSV